MLCSYYKSESFDEILLDQNTRNTSALVILLKRSLQTGNVKILRITRSFRSTNFKKTFKIFQAFQFILSFSLLANWPATPAFARPSGIPMVEVGKES